MTEVAFHFGASDKLAYASRLLRKATATGARVLVCADEADAQALQASVWALAPTEFISICDTQAPDTVRSRSSVQVSSDTQLADVAASVLVNLQSVVPGYFAKYARVIEIVGLAEDDRQHARRRWKQYSDLGYTIAKHDLAARSAAHA